jgi:hypothetical protein
MKRMESQKTTAPLHQNPLEFPSLNSRCLDGICKKTFRDRLVK